ncbi:hypothetical protein AAMO2058_000113900 [Amorphochlora amoebiformis]
MVVSLPTTIPAKTILFGALTLLIGSALFSESAYMSDSKNYSPVGVYVAKYTGSGRGGPFEAESKITIKKDGEVVCGTIIHGCIAYGLDKFMWNWDSDNKLLSFKNKEGDGSLKATSPTTLEYKPKGAPKSLTYSLQK